MQWRWLTWHWTIAIAIRLVLLALGIGDAMLWRPEVSTPANTLLKAREGVWLLQMGLSPYSGSACNHTPLWLAVTAPWSQHLVMYALPNMICDAVSAAAVLLAAASLHNSNAGATQRDAPWLSPEQLSVMYLLNPFTFFTCVAGSSTSAENMGVMLAVAGGLMRNAPMAAAGVAVGTYMGLHPILLVLPLLLLLWRGPEDVLEHVPPPVPGLMVSSRKARIKEGNAPDASSHENHDDLGAATSSDESPSHPGAAQEAAAASKPEATDRRMRQRRKSAQPAAQVVLNGSAAERLPQQEGNGQHQAGAAVGRLLAVGRRQSGVLCWLFLAVLLVSSVALLILSDSMMQPHSDTQCIPRLLRWVQQAARWSSNSVQQPRSQWSKCWAVRVYSFSLLLEDYTPTIGLWWYFFTELFDAFRPFFLFVFHSFAVILAVPVAIRFSHRPLFVMWVQLYITCMFKPYACVGDMVPWMSLLPLLQQQLQCIKLGMFFVNSMLLLMVLGPAMWHQWIVMDAANSNFFYSITLLLGVWYTVFLVHMMSLTALLDRRLSRRPVVLYADELEESSPPTAELQPVRTVA